MIPFHLIQEAATSELVTSPFVVAAGLKLYSFSEPEGETGIIMDRGQFPVIPGRENALKAYGVCLTVMTINPKQARQLSRGGDVEFSVEIDVLVEEMTNDNKTGHALERWCWEVAQAISGKPLDENETGQPLVLKIITLGDTLNSDGMREGLVTFSTAQILTTAAEEEIV